MARCDPKNVAVEWLDAYEAGSLDLIVAMHSSDAAIECACGDSKKKIQGRRDISEYWRHRLIESPALGLDVLRADDRVATLSYRTGNEIVEAVLDVSNEGLITRCRCGPAGHLRANIDWPYVLSLAAILTMTAVCILLFAI